LAGAAAVGAYTISCDATRSASGTTETPSAGEVPYANGQSGLVATTVQAALDEIGTTMESALTNGGVVTGGGTAKSSVWTLEMKVLDGTTETLTSTNKGTVTLTETAPGQGSYQTSGANVFVLDGLAGPPTGTQVGKYFLLEGLVSFTGEVSPGTKTATTWHASLSHGGRTLTLNNFGAVTLVLTRP
jgi:hypothetical protein